MTSNTVTRTLVGLTCLVTFTSLVVAAEQQVSVNAPNKPESPEIEAPSPLLSEQTRGPYLTLDILAIKPSAMLYPVSIKTINGFSIKPLVHGYQYHLKAGSYEITARPDFSLVSDIKPFMNKSYEQQTFKLTLVSGKSYLLGARVNPDLANDWRLEIMEMGVAAEPAVTP